MPANNNQPVLRFPGFNNDWEEKKLGEISSDVMYGMNAASKKFDGKHKYLRITDIDDTSRQFLTSSLTSPDGELVEKYLLKERDILFTRTGASVGKSYYYKTNDGIVYFAGFLIKFHIKKTINPYFVFLNTLRTNYENWVTKMSMRSGQPGINAEEYKTLTINLPTLPEQEKIAGFLSAVDESLQQLQRRQMLLLRYKKGCMQQLFSRQLRFKDDAGNDFPDWEGKSLGNSIPLQRGFDLPIDKVVEGKFPVVFSNGILKYHNEYKAKGPGVVTGRSGTIGKVIYVEQDYWPHNTALWVTDFTNNYPKYVYYFYLNLDLKTLSSGSGVPTLNRNDIHRLNFPFPSLEEQTKIANFLTALDDQIEPVKQQVRQTQVYKKGLLQQLFV